MSRDLKSTRTRSRGISRKINHSPRILGSEHIHMNEVVNGMILSFGYRGKKIYDQTPMILFLYRDGHLIHGINLNYLTESEVQHLFKSILKSTNIKMTELEHLEEKHTLIGIHDKKNSSGISPEKFYNKFLKGDFLLEHPNSYRTYDSSKISGIKSINYKIDIMEQAVRKRANLKTKDMSTPDLQKHMSKIDEPIIIDKSDRRR